MPDIVFEDFRPGEVSTFGAYRVEREEMVAFARDFDAQPFHLDEAAAAAAPIGRLIASGWYSCAVQMRLMCDAWLTCSASLGGPGIEELRWITPVVVGDVLSVRQEVLDARASVTRPGMGIVRFRSELLRESGEVVMRLTQLGMQGRRDRAEAPRAEAPRVEPPSSFGTPEPLFPAEDPATAPRCFEDVEIGRGVDLGSYAFTRDNIVAFASRYDTQSFHLDEAAAARGPFGALAASGWHTAAAWMSRFAARLHRIGEAGERPRISVSPGFRDLQWLRPVHAGDTIRYASEPIEKRPLASRPGWGVITSRNSGRNGRGETVFAFTGSVFWQMRAT